MQFFSVSPYSKYFGKKWRKKPCSTCLKTHFSTDSRVPENPISGIPDPSLITHIYDIEMNIRISENIDKDVDVDGNKVAEDNAPRKLGCDAMFNGE